MDSADNPNCKSPVAVTVASDQEPVECNGSLAVTDGGFVLEFSAGDNVYTVMRENDRTRIKAAGILSYELGFGCESDTTVVTPMGSIQLSVAPIACAVSETTDGIDLEFSYKLKAGDTEHLRNVKVTARYLAQNHN